MLLFILGLIACWMLFERKCTEVFTDPTEALFADFMAGENVDVCIIVIYSSCVSNMIFFCFNQGI